MSFGYVNPFPVFRPQLMFISAITQADPGVVTTTANHNYLSGLIVRLLIPLPMGTPQLVSMTQLNGMEFPIMVLSANTFSIPIDTSFFDPFVVPPDPQMTSPQVVPTGEINEILYQAVYNILE
jgi:hypothetical protein